MEKVIRDKLAGTQEIVRTPESQTDEAAAMGFLVRVAEDLNSTPELDAVLRKVAERVKEQVEYDTFSILLLDDIGRGCSRGGGPLGQRRRVARAPGRRQDVRDVSRVFHDRRTLAVRDRE